MHRSHGTFHSTMNPMDLSIRGHNATRRHRVPVASTVQLNLSRSFNGADQEALSLRREALMAKHKTTTHMQSLKGPVPKATIRKDTNAALLDHEKDQKALVLSLREIEQAGIQQARRLERATRQLGAFLEDHCRRAVWLNRESMARRGSVGGTADAVALQLHTEQRITSQVLTSVSQQHGISTHARKTLDAALQTANKTIKREARGLGLNPDTYSGSVQRYPRPQGTPPPVVVQLRDAIAVAKQATGDTQELIRASKEELARARQAVDDKLKDAVSRAKATEADMLQTGGEMRGTLHRSQAMAKKTEVAAEMDVGPRERRFMSIADSAYRPRMREYSKGRGVSRNGLQRWETSQSAQRSLAATQREVDKDLRQIRDKKRQVSEAARDTRRLAERDQELLRFRRRCKPGNRVPTRP